MEARICVRCWTPYVPVRKKQKVCSLACRRTIPNAQRTCPGCKKTFTATRNNKTACSATCLNRYWQESNRPYINAKRNERRLSNPESYALQVRLTRHRITIQQWNELRAIQDGRCAICRRHESELPSSRKYGQLCIDHNHKTGKVRGLLCGNCNGLLGFADDHPERLEEAIRYLRAGGSVGMRTG